MKLLNSPKFHYANSFVSTNIGGNCSRNAVFGIKSVPRLVRLRFHTSKTSVISFDVSKFSIRNDFGQRKSFPMVLPSALSFKSSSECDSSLSPSVDNRAKIVAWSALTFIFAVTNRVLHKLALVPMKDYPFFLAQFNSFVYVAVYFSLLLVRYRVGITTDEMLALPKTRFVIVGLLEAVSTVSAMYAGAVLPGPVIPLLYQTFLAWQLVFSSFLLGKRYSLNQILGCFLVAAGVVVAVTSGSGKSGILSGVGLVWPALMVAACGFQAGASIVKESIFVDAATRLKGKSLDIFVVNAFDSGFQAVFILLFLPILSNLKGIPLSKLPSYIQSASACLLNIGTNTTGCNGAPLLPLLYIISNILFKISILNLLKVSNAIVASLAVRASVPIAIYVLSLPLPYLAKGVSLSPLFHLGSLILVAGLVLYNARGIQKQEAHTS